MADGRRTFAGLKQKQIIRILVVNQLYACRQKPSPRNRAKIHSLGSAPLSVVSIASLVYEKLEVAGLKGAQLDSS